MTPTPVTQMTRPRARRNAALAFVREIPRTEACVLWPYSLGRNGYGQLWYEGKMANAHRVALRMYRGEPPFPKAVAAHSCGRKDCVNPRHLRWATQKDNLRDRIDHGTMHYSKRNGNNKLSEEAVVDIFLSRDVPQQHLADKYNVSQPTISNIQNGYRWTWFTDTLTTKEKP